MKRCLLVALLIAGCGPHIPGGVYHCTSNSQCPDGYSCGDGGLCYEGCAAQTCAGLRANCGMIDNGCGTMIDCGDCSGGQICGATVPNICGCDPLNCETGITCGPIDNGCGSTIDCGPCPGALPCNGGFCMCGVVVDCTDRCGWVDDGCGGFTDCGLCPPEMPYCGGGGPGVCGTTPCVPMTSCGPGQCGPIEDGCGGFVECPDCTAPEFCDALVFGQCGCRERSCAELGLNCGDVVDPCTENVLHCGSCDFGTCGGGGVPNVCDCSVSCDGRCGDVESCDPAGGVITQCVCPTSPDGTSQTCNSNTGLCLCPADTLEINDTEGAARRLGALTVGAVNAYSNVGIHSIADDDWYEWSLSSSVASTYLFRFQVTGIPLDANYDIGLGPICAGGVPVITCLAGSFDMGRGCASANDGNAETIEMMVTGCSVSGVRAVVHPQVLGASCSFYHMEMSQLSVNTTDGTTP